VERGEGEGVRGGGSGSLAGHDDPKKQVDDQAGESGKDREDSVENSDQRGVPTEPFGQPATDAGDHTIVRKHQGHEKDVSEEFFVVDSVGAMVLIARYKIRPGPLNCESAGWDSQPHPSGRRRRAKFNKY